MIVPLHAASTRSCGSKAGALGTLLRAGIAVPDGYAVPLDVYTAAVRELQPAALARRDGPAAARAAILGSPVPAGLREALTAALEALDGIPVAVRSSASDEDAQDRAAAGQYTSVLAVRGPDAVVEAVRSCWASLYADTAVADRRHRGRDGYPAMGVVVQRHLDAAVSGVMFTPSGPGSPTVVEASWGLGPSVVEGAVNPDVYTVCPDSSVVTVVADKRTRLDRRCDQLVTRDVPAGERGRPVLDDAGARRLAELGRRVADALGGAQDVEWAIADGRYWVLQARPITAALPDRTRPPNIPASASGARVVTGAPGSRGTATGLARVVRGPADFSRVGRGDILVCPWTDPSWTPLLQVAGGVVTEVGGVLSHAAIVARERGIPAVLGVPDATRLLADATPVTVDGSAGVVTTAVD